MSTHSRYSQTSVWPGMQLVGASAFFFGSSCFHFISCLVQNHPFYTQAIKVLDPYTAFHQSNTNNRQHYAHLLESTCLPCRLNHPSAPIPACRHTSQIRTTIFPYISVCPEHLLHFPTPSPLPKPIKWYPSRVCGVCLGDDRVGHRIGCQPEYGFMIVTLPAKDNSASGERQTQTLASYRGVRKNYELDVWPGVLVTCGACRRERVLASTLFSSETFSYVEEHYPALKSFIRYGLLPARGGLTGLVLGAREAFAKAFPDPVAYGNPSQPKNRAHDEKAAGPVASNLSSPTAARSPEVTMPEGPLAYLGKESGPSAPPSRSQPFPLPPPEPSLTLDISQPDIGPLLTDDEEEDLPTLQDLLARTRPGYSSSQIQGSGRRTPAPTALVNQPNCDRVKKSQQRSLTPR